MKECPLVKEEILDSFIPTPVKITNVSPLSHQILPLDIEDLFCNGVISHYSDCIEPTACPVFLVGDSSKPRMVVDTSKLRNMVKKVEFPTSLPEIEIKKDCITGP